MIKKQRITIILSAVLILITCVIYFAAVKPFIEARSAAEEAPETLEGEALSASNKYYIYSQLTRDQMKSIEVSNESGTYRFVKVNGDFVIEGHEGIAVDSTMLSSLVVSCGTTLSTTKVMDNAPDEKLEEYGLLEPHAYWIVTDNSGKQYKVYVGRELLTGQGYYCMFAGRKSVYVLDDTLAYTVLSPVEAYVTPYILLGISQDDYYTIDNFSVYRDGAKFITVGLVPTENQTNSEALAEHILTYPAPYAPNTTTLYSLFMRFIAFTGESTYKLGADEESLDGCGLGEPEYMVSFDYKSREYYFLVSPPDDDGYCYVVSNVYSDIITKIPKESLDFLDYGMMDWISSYIFQYYITSVSEISIATDNTNVTFSLSHGYDSNGANALAVKVDGGSAITSTSEINNFRQYYKTLLSIDVQDYLPETVPETGEEISGIVSDDSRRNMVFTVTDLSGEKVTYEFYRYTTRRAAVKVNGNAEFYVPYDIVQKIENDTLRFLNGEEIDSYGKN